MRGMHSPLDPYLQDCAERICRAAQQGQQLRIRGGGTKDFYGQPWPADMPVLETRAYSGIVSYEPSELVVTVRAGTGLTELEAVLAEKGQHLAFEPPNLRGWVTSQPVSAGQSSGGAVGATVGGMVAAGLSGPARAAAGSVRDYVLGMRILNGRGQDLHFGGTVMKNVAGYDISRLMVGSLGTLGLITEVSLKVLPLAPAEATLRFEMDEATAIEQLNAWAGQPLPLNASSWVIDQGRPSLYLRLRGAVAAVQAACKKLGTGYGAVRVDSPETSADWSAARELQLPWFQDGFARADDLWRISVPQATPPLGLGDTMIDWFGGQRWLFAPAGQRGQAAARIRHAAYIAGGHATLFVASDSYPIWDKDQKGFEITPHFDALQLPLDRIHRQLKAEFDPAGVFNPGRLGAI